MLQLNGISLLSMRKIINEMKIDKIVLGGYKMNYIDILINGSDEIINKLLKYDLSEDEKRAIFKIAVEIINIETSYKCNRKCDYCPVSESTRSTEQIIMDTSVIEKIARQLSEIRYENRISLNLYNEPLLDEKLEEKIKILRNYLPWASLGINSNGDMLNRSRIKTLSNAGLNYICVTLHPQPFKIDSTNILTKRIKKMIEKNTDSDNLEFELNNGFVEFIAQGIRLKIQWPNWRILGTDRGGQVRNYNGGKIERIQPCVKPFREFTIFFDGDIQPCCESFHDTNTQLTNIANINNTNIFEAYTSPKLVNFRRSLFGFSKKKGICEYCSSVDYSEIEKDSSIRERFLKVNQDNAKND
jgi:MoaA/NifB/PqqE/SkfB family radical SAM enzyme